MAPGLIKHARCELHGIGGDSAFASAVSFLRGFAVLYGDGLAVQIAAHSTIEELGDTLANVGTATRINEPQSPADTYAVLHIEDDSSGPGRPARVFVMFGDQALQDWLRVNLLEPRYDHPDEADFADLPQSDASAIRIFVSGDRSQVGKSTVCVGIVGSLLSLGYAPSEIAYIKPATQCEKPQLIAKFCRHHGITCCDIGPILFYSGFTREFLKGTTDSTDELLEKAKLKVDEVARGKKVVVIDGVGYPAVGSICGVSNADVAAAVRAPVVLVGRKGVGDAVDSFNLNACFFESRGVKVLGAIFNRLPPDGFYSLANCREHVSAYFQRFQPDKTPYGFIPELGVSAEEAVPADGTAAMNTFMTAAESSMAGRIIDAFPDHVDLPKLLRDAQEYRPGAEILQTSRQAVDSGSTGAKKTRQEIQAAARAAGASGCM